MGMQEKDEKPFWAQFLRSDYIKEKEPKPLLGMVMDVLDGNAKLEEYEDD